MKHQQQQALSQQWAANQPEYGNGPTSMMEVNTGEMQSDWQPLSLPTNIQDANTYEPNMQYMRGNIDESVQYQQPQDYWNQSYYQGNYGRDESTPGLISQADIDNSQQQDKWKYEVR